MEIRRRAMTVGVTFFIALATGHLMQNADQIAALLSGKPVPASQKLTQVEPTVAVLKPAAASAIISVSRSAEKAPTAISDDLSQVLPNLPAAQPDAFAHGTFLAKRIRLLGDNGTSPVLVSDPGHEVFGFR